MFRCVFQRARDHHVLIIIITILQRDLNTLSEWANKWLMSFNPSKCVHLTITRKTNPLKSSYSICGSVIQQSNSTKYLGVTITSNLSWSEHINNITNKANSMRAFLQRNLNQSHQSVKSTCYITYVRPILEYASTVWFPHQVGDINRLEMVQRRAVRFVCNNFNRTASVTAMLNHLNLNVEEIKPNSTCFTKLLTILFQYHMTI